MCIILSTKAKWPWTLIPVGESASIGTVISHMVLSKKELILRRGFLDIGEQQLRQLGVGLDHWLGEITS